MTYLAEVPNRRFKEGRHLDLLNSLVAEWLS